MYGWTDGQKDRQTDKPKLFAAVRNFAIGPNNLCLEPNHFQITKLERCEAAHNQI